MKTVGFFEAETACIEATSKLSLLFDYLDKKSLAIDPEEELVRDSIGGEICLVIESLEAVKTMQKYLYQEVMDKKEL